MYESEFLIFSLGRKRWWRRFCPRPFGYPTRSYIMYCRELQWRHSSNYKSNRREVRIHEFSRGEFRWVVCILGTPQITVSISVYDWLSNISSATPVPIGSDHYGNQEMSRFGINISKWAFLNLPESGYGDCVYLKGRGSLIRQEESEIDMLRGTNHFCVW